MLNSTKLRQIAAVDRAGSFSGASKTMNVSQSTLTKAVADVETDLGFALFIRTARGVVATPEGREFLNRAARIAADFEMLAEDIKLQRQHNDQRLRVGISPAIIEGLFNHATATLLSQMPEISLSLLGMPFERGLQLLKRGDIDLLCGPLIELEREKELCVDPVHTLSMQLFCRKGHPILDIPSPSLEDICHHKLVTSDLYELFGRQVEQIFRYEDSDRHHQVHIINNFSIVMEVVANTDALSFVSSDYARTRTFQERFARINVDVFDPMEFGMARLSRWLPSRSVRAFQDVVKDQLGFRSEAP